MVSKFESMRYWFSWLYALFRWLAYIRFCPHPSSVHSWSWKSAKQTTTTMVRLRWASANYSRSVGTFRSIIIASLAPFGLISQFMLHCVNDKNAIHSRCSRFLSPSASHQIAIAVPFIVRCYEQIDLSCVGHNRNHWDCYLSPSNHENVNGSRHADASAHLFTFICMVITIFHEIWIGINPSR